MGDINKKDVVIIDDCLLIRERIREIVNSSTNFNVIGEACNGIDAVNLIDAYRPDFIVLDIRMPDKSGISVLYEIQDYVKDMCVIVLTNHYGEAYKERCLKLGASYFLDKTKEIEKLKALFF